MEKTLQKEDLVFALKLTQPALATIDFVPINAHFCFEGDSVYAHNGELTVRVGLETGLHCGIHGVTLVRLSDLASKKISLTQEGDEVKFSSGRTRATLPVKAASDFVASMPSGKTKVPEVALTDEFFDALDVCTKSVGADPHHSELTCVTLFLGPDTRMYAGDGQSLVVCPLKTQIGKKSRVLLLPSQLCRIVLQTKAALDMGDAGVVYFSVVEDGVVFRFDAAFPVSIFGKGMAESPADYEGMVGRLESSAPKVTLPALFDAAVQKAAAVLDLDINKVVTLAQIKADGGKQRLVVSSDGSLGKVSTSLLIDDKLILEELVAQVVPSHLLRYISQVSHISVSEEVVRMYGPGFTFYVPTFSE